MQWWNDHPTATDALAFHYISRVQHSEKNTLDFINTVQHDQFNPKEMKATSKATLMKSTQALRDRWGFKEFDLREHLPEIEAFEGKHNCTFGGVILRTRDIIDVQRRMFARKRAVNGFVTAPSILRDTEGTRVYGDLHTGKFWGNVDAQLSPLQVLGPMLWFSDKALLSGKLSCATTQLIA